MDYADIIYDQLQNEYFCKKSTDVENIYQELRLEPLTSRRWHRQWHILSCMFKKMKEEVPNYLIYLIPKCTTIRVRNNYIPTYNCRTDDYKCSFIPSTLNDWLDLDINIRNSEFKMFKNRLLLFIRPVQSNIYNILKSQPQAPTRLFFGLSHFYEHRFRHFQKCMNPSHSYCLKVENTYHYLMCCHHFSHHCIDRTQSVN